MYRCTHTPHTTEPSRCRHAPFCCPLTYVFFLRPCPFPHPYARRSGYFLHPEGCILSRRQGKSPASAPKADRHGGDSGGPRAGKAALGNIRGELFCLFLVGGTSREGAREVLRVSVQDGSLALILLHGSRKPRAPARALSLAYLPSFATMPKNQWRAKAMSYFLCVSFVSVVFFLNRRKRPHNLHTRLW